MAVAASYEEVEVGVGFEIRIAPASVGGVGRFPRSPELLMDELERQRSMTAELLQEPYDKLVEQIGPKEAKLAELRQKFDETDNTIFSSQILPIEVKLRPLVRDRDELEEDLEYANGAINYWAGMHEEAMAKRQESGEADVWLSGRDTYVTIEVGRSFALGPAPEASLEVSGQEGGVLEVQAQWKTERAEQTVLVDERAGGSRIVVSFVSPEEGLKKLCAVAEWNGETKADDVRKRKQDLLTALNMDGLLVVDKDAAKVTMRADPNPFNRRNELWVEIVPPEGADNWLLHAGHISTENPAKNSSFYQLKDIPWATPTPWGAGGGEKQGGGAASWSASTGLGGNTLRAVFPPSASPLALDRNALGELAAWRVPMPEGEEGGEDRREYAVAYIPGWPLTGTAVEAGRAALIRALESSPFSAPEPESFRVLITAPGAAELWVLVDRS